ncbi:MAG: hypothetical protein Q4G33_03985 [bacterium]|nr:hypothetical protein [bacterium]
MNFTEKLIDSKLINIHTAFIGKVISINGNTARVQPLTYSKNMNGKLIEQTPIAAHIPRNIKTKCENITYRISEYDSQTTTVIVPDELVIGDIVYCGVSERDISAENLGGKIAEPTRHHDINDSVILAVF